MNVTPTKTKITGEMSLGNQHFTYEVYLLPIPDNHPEKQNIEEDLIRRLGSRIKNGSACLGMDETVARNNIANNLYAAVGFVKNKNHDDEASATLQHFDWCTNGKPDTEKRGKQIWICDLCRITNGIKPDQSPVKVLFSVFEKVVMETLRLKLKHIHLMVKNELLSPLVSDEAKILVNIYKKYGFSVIAPLECHVQDKYIIMRKPISFRSKRKRKTRGKITGVKKRTIRTRA